MTSYTDVFALPEPLKIYLADNADDLMAVALERTAKGKGRLWQDEIDLDFVIGQFYMLLMDGRSELPGLRAAVLNKSHLLMYTVQTSWLNPKKRWLTEQFFLRIGKGSSDDAFAALETLAADQGATTIIMATALAPRDAALGSLYQRHGYSLQSSQWIKQVEASDGSFNGHSPAGVGAGSRRDGSV